MDEKNNEKFETVMKTMYGISDVDTMRANFRLTGGMAGGFYQGLIDSGVENGVALYMTIEYVKSIFPFGKSNENSEN